MKRISDWFFWKIWYNKVADAIFLRIQTIMLEDVNINMISVQYKDKVFKVVRQIDGQITLNPKESQ